MAARAPHQKPLHNLQTQGAIYKRPLWKELGALATQGHPRFSKFYQISKKLFCNIIHRHSKKIEKIDPVTIVKGWCTIFVSTLVLDLKKGPS